MDAGAATDVEVSGYITKPIDFEKLVGRIAELTASPSRLWIFATSSLILDESEQIVRFYPEFA